MTPTIGGVLDVISYVSRSQIHVIGMIDEVEAGGEHRVIASLPTVPLVDHLMTIRGFV